MPVLFWVSAGKFFVVFYCADWANINTTDIDRTDIIRFLTADTIMSAIITAGILV